MRVTLLALAALAALPACKKHELSYHKVEFPGFALEAPSKLGFTADPVTSYATGQSQFTDEGEGQVVAVTWQAGAIATVDEMPAYVQAMAAMLPNSASMRSQPAHTIKVAGKDATVVDATIENVQLSFVDIPCGARSVMIAVGATSGQPAILARMLGSFDCHPVAERDQAIATAVPIGVDDPAALTGWARVEVDGVFMLSDGARLAVFGQFPNTTAIPPSAFDKMATSLFPSFGMTWAGGQVETRTIDGSERPFLRGKVGIDDTVLDGALSLVQCPGNQTMLMSLLMGPAGTDLDASIAFLAKVRCSKPGDAPLALKQVTLEEAAGAPTVDKP